MVDRLSEVDVLNRLARGAHPITGAPIDAPSWLNDVRVIRALLRSADAIAGQPRTDLPPNAGTPWDDDQDDDLEAAFKRAEPFDAIARRMGRTRGAIISRLKRLGLME